MRRDSNLKAGSHRSHGQLLGEEARYRERGQSLCAGPLAKAEQLGVEGSPAILGEQIDASPPLERPAGLTGLERGPVAGDGLQYVDPTRRPSGHAQLGHPRTACAQIKRAQECRQ